MLPTVNYRDPNKQRKYRSELLQIYNNKCPITNTTQDLEAAHIVPWILCNKININISYCKYNGVILSRKIHRSEFEPFKFTFDYPNYQYYDDDYIKIGFITQNDYKLKIYNYRYRKILMPKPSLYFIRYHYYEYQKKHNPNQNYLENIDYLEQIKHIDNKSVYDKDSDTIMLPV